ncbi:hypothetical protein SASPL_148708 [Salvia splendens]|uniref:GAG-pre-integrase domain-containing protein n=1 Tax=Salvia splendens TaxID=180675 RepID=A0A8X8Z4L0_SALSN|nr:hypothetical protein SASPL_148708 [Salvia splendens]
MLETSISDDLVNVVGKQCSPELWHKRLSHISAKGLETLTKKNIFSGAQSSSFEKCSHCLEGEQNRVKTNGGLSKKTDWKEIEVHQDNNDGEYRRPFEKYCSKTVHLDWIWFGYKLYDPAEKKVIRSNDVVFYEDQTMDDIDKAKSSNSHSHDDIIDIDPSSISHLPTIVGGNAVEAEMPLDDFADYQ